VQWVRSLAGLAAVALVVVAVAKPGATRGGALATGAARRAVVVGARIGAIATVSRATRKVDFASVNDLGVAVVEAGLATQNARATIARRRCIDGAARIAATATICWVSQRIGGASTCSVTVAVQVARCRARRITALAVEARFAGSTGVLARATVLGARLQIDFTTRVPLPVAIAVAGLARRNLTRAIEALDVGVRFRATCRAIGTMGGVCLGVCAGIPAADPTRGTSAITTPTTAGYARVR